MLPIKILHLEDSATDAELIARDLRKARLNCSIEVVKTKTTFIEALKNFTYDIILSDHSLSSLDSFEALELVAEHGIKVPFILITSSMSDEFAVQVMKGGADDYIIKDRLHRLSSAIVNLVEKYRLQMEQKQVMKLAAEALEKSEKRFKALIEKSTDIIALVDADGTLFYGSPSIENVFGYTSKEFLNLPLSRMIHPDDLPAYDKNIKNLLSDAAGDFFCQQRIKHKDGSWIWCEGTTTNLLDEPGVNALVSNFRDITDRKNAEQIIKNGAAFNRAVLNSLSSHIAVIDHSGQVIAVNNSWETFSIENGDATLAHTGKGSNYFDVCENSAKDGNQFASQALTGIKQIFDENLPAFSLEYPCHSPEKERWFGMRALRLESDKKMVVVSHLDITERKLSERILLKNEAMLAEAQAMAKVGNWEIDLLHQGETWSDEMYKILALSNTIKASRDTLLKFIHPEDRAYVEAQLFENVDSFKDGSTEFRVIANDGDVKNICSTWAVERSSNEEPVRAYGIFQDISSGKQAEQERNKLLSDLMGRNIDLEQFSYIISHNLRSPVANILGIMEILNLGGLSEDDDRMLHTSLQDCVKKLDDVVMDLNQVLTVKSHTNDIREPVLLTDLVVDIEASIKDIFNRSDVKIKSDFSSCEELFTVKGFIYSIFYNLVTNSIKYCKENVPCEIGITSVKTDEKTQLIFSDNGMGIDLSKKSEDVFKLYKRFHPGIEGKGMGLFMVKTQVEALGGIVSLQSELGKGTEFKIEFYNEGYR